MKNIVYIWESAVLLWFISIRSCVLRWKCINCWLLLIELLGEFCSCCSQQLQYIWECGASVLPLIALLLAISINRPTDYLAPPKSSNFIFSFNRALYYAWYLSSIACYTFSSRIVDDCLISCCVILLLSFLHRQDPAILTPFKVFDP